MGQYNILVTNLIPLEGEAEDIMASFAQAALKRLKPLTDAASRAGNLVSTHGSSAYKGMMESNKQFVADPATPEKAAELTKKAFYTQLAT